MSASVPRVSVVMSVYNCEAYVGEAIRSILDQTFRDFEFLIIDDGSRDGSLAVLERHARQDPRIQVFNAPNRGVAEARNEMNLKARGEFIAVMDADDISLPERFERQVSYLDAHPECVAVGCYVQVIDDAGDPLCLFDYPTTHEEIDAANVEGRGLSLCHPSIMFRRRAVLEAGNNPPGLAHDLGLCLQLAERGGRLANLPEPMFKYRMHRGQISTARIAQQVSAANEVVREARRRRNLPAEFAPRRVIEEELGDKYRKLGWWALRAGHARVAWKYARFSLRLAPFSKERMA